MKRITCLVLLLATFVSHAQQGYQPVRGYWDNPGYPGTRPQFSEQRNILDFGGDASGKSSANPALAAAIADLGGRPGTIVFPGGTYVFDEPVIFQRDSLILLGAGHDSTRLKFGLGGRILNAISIAGHVDADSSLLRSPLLRGDSVLHAANAGSFKAGDWIRISIDDAAYMTSDWARGSLGQTARIVRITGDKLVLDSRARFSYVLSLRPRIRRVFPRTDIGIECLAIERTDATSAQTSTVVYDQAVNCWLSGIESGMSNFAHVEINRASNIDIRNAFFHDAFAHGGGGQGYGVLLQNGSNRCLVTGNYFRRLRHSMLLQSGANGNVLSYNYSTKPYWTETNLPDSSAGEIVLHGNYPFMNLLEGNVVQNIVIDDSHGINGPLNTFFRNRARGYGFFMNFMPPTDSQQFIGNEVTNAATGMFFISGKGHYQFSNGVNTAGTGAIPDESLYLSAGRRPDCSAALVWPAIGEKEQFNTGSIPAQVRAESGVTATCGCTGAAVPTAVRAQIQGSGSWELAPNPAGSFVRIAGLPLPERADLHDATGRLLRRFEKPVSPMLDLRDMPRGLYLLRLQGPGRTDTYRLLLQ